MKNTDIKSLIIGFLCCALLLITMGFKSANDGHIVCESITIENKNQNEIAYIGPNTLGGGLLTISNKFYKPIVYLGEDEESSGLFKISNKYDVAVFSAGVDVDDSAGMLDIMDNRGALMGRLVVVDNQGVFITLDSQGNITGSLPIE